ncbi:hypothetical protein N431DRAFT_522972 [Stipitochalara longipes BDJ]|nr:hypothetical protein N431DRAFT_522972 [Stipitochalara longipes BDJ]
MGFLKSLALVGLAIPMVAAAGKVCSQIPYDIFLPLSTYAPALSFCSSKFALPTPTCYATLTSTSTYVTVYTTSIPIATLTSTVTTGSESSTTITLTISPATSTISSIFYTATSTILSCPVAAKDRIRKRIIHTSTTPKPTSTSKPPPPNPLATLFSNLASEAEGFVSTLCSCLETTPTCTTTTIHTSATHTSVTTLVADYSVSTTVSVPNTQITTFSTIITLPTPLTTTIRTISAVQTTTMCTSCTGGAVPGCNEGTIQNFCDGSTVNCYCSTTSEGVNFCSYSAVVPYCSGQTCVTSSDCPMNNVCVISGCCGISLCTPTVFGPCSTGSSVAARAAALERMVWEWRRGNTSAVPSPARNLPEVLVSSL